MVLNNLKMTLSRLQHKLYEINLGSDIYDKAK